MSKYNRTALQELDVSEVAKRVRAEIAKRVKSGALPQIKTSVRTRRFAGGCALDVEVLSVPDGFPVASRARVEQEYRHPHEHTHLDALSTEARLLLESLREIVAPYHWDVSDISSDYFCCNFYLSIQVDHGLRAAQVQAIRAELEQADAAREAEEAEVARQAEEAEARRTPEEGARLATRPYQVTVKWSESPSSWLADGQRYPTLDAFTGALRREQRAMKADGRSFCKVAFAITLEDGARYEGRHDLQTEQRAGLASLPGHVLGYLRNALVFERERGEAEPIFQLSDQERRDNAFWTAFVEAATGEADVAPAPSAARAPVLRVVAGGKSEPAPMLSERGAEVAASLGEAVRAIRGGNLFAAGLALGMATRGTRDLAADERARAEALCETLTSHVRKHLNVYAVAPQERQLVLFGRG